MWLTRALRPCTPTRGRWWQRQGWLSSYMAHHHPGASAIGACQRNNSLALRSHSLPCGTSVPRCKELQRNRGWVRSLELWSVWCPSPSSPTYIYLLYHSDKWSMLCQCLLLSRRIEPSYQPGISCGIHYIFGWWRHYVYKNLIRMMTKPYPAGVPPKRIQKTSVPLLGNIST